MCLYCFLFLTLCLKVVSGFFSQQKQSRAEKECYRIGPQDQKWSEELLRSLSPEFKFFWGILYCLKVKAPRFVFRDLVPAHLSVILTLIKARGDCQHPPTCCAHLLSSTCSTEKYLVLDWEEEAPISSVVGTGDREEKKWDYHLLAKILNRAELLLLFCSSSSGCSGGVEDC